MAQIDRLFTSIWHNTTTGPGTPLTGLSATITIRDKSTNTIVVNNQAMTEIGLGEYDYTFATMDATKPYSYIMNPNSTLAYVVTGFVDPRLAYVDKSVSEIAVGWNPYITGIGGIQKGIQRVVDKIEEKGNEIIKEIEESEDEVIKAFPEYKEAVMNVTTEKLDTKEFLTAIREIKPNVTTEKVVIDMKPVIDAVRSVGKITDIQFPEQKETDLSEIKESLTSIVNSIEGVREDIEKTSESKKRVSEGALELIEEIMSKNEREKKEEKDTEEENMRRPLPSSFTATLN